MNDGGSAHCSSLKHSTRTNQDQRKIRKSTPLIPMIPYSLRRTRSGFPPRLVRKKKHFSYSTIDSIVCFDVNEKLFQITLPNPTGHLSSSVKYLHAPVPVFPKFQSIFLPTKHSLPSGRGRIYPRKSLCAAQPYPPTWRKSSTVPSEYNLQNLLVLSQSKKTETSKPNFNENRWIFPPTSPIPKDTRHTQVRL